ncbi:DUF1203 domain-containing protein [Sandarakinorhabdus oryzae]|uniref:DUF1203 domain-containing protein n=1 Tax=Sandarakinorhabdus oryzae TaxID=2675220 RepID=UPI0012E12BDE|nr:DUF1203 domain-containing protein [Sandarakinorhabdus oryzae]
MTDFRAIGMDHATATRLRAASHDVAGNRMIIRDSGGPCRFTLTDHPAGSHMRLFSWAVPEPAGVYALQSPIFLSVDGEQAWDAPGVVPPVVAARKVALRAYDADGLMVYPANTLVLDGGHDQVIRDLLARPDVAFLNCHTALAGCYLCRFERA